MNFRLYFCLLLFSSLSRLSFCMEEGSSTDDKTISYTVMVGVGLNAKHEVSLQIARLCTALSNQNKPHNNVLKIGDFDDQGAAPAIFNMLEEVIKQNPQPKDLEDLLVEKLFELHDQLKDNSGAASYLPTWQGCVKFFNKLNINGLHIEQEKVNDTSHINLWSVRKELNKRDYYIQVTTGQINSLAQYFATFSAWKNITQSFSVNDLSKIVYVPLPFSLRNNPNEQSKRTAQLLDFCLKEDQRRGANDIGSSSSQNHNDSISSFCKAIKDSGKKSLSSFLRTLSTIQYLGYTEKSKKIADQLLFIIVDALATLSEGNNINFFETLELENIFPALAKDLSKEQLMDLAYGAVIAHASPLDKASREQNPPLQLFFSSSSNSQTDPIKDNNFNATWEFDFVLKKREYPDHYARMFPATYVKKHLALRGKRRIKSTSGGAIEEIFIELLPTINQDPNILAHCIALKKLQEKEDYEELSLSSDLSPLIKQLFFSWQTTLKAHYQDESNHHCVYSLPDGTLYRFNFQEDNALRMEFKSNWLIRFFENNEKKLRGKEPFDQWSALLNDKKVQTTDLYYYPSMQPKGSFSGNLTPNNSWEQIKTEKKIQNAKDSKFSYDSPVINCAQIRWSLNQ